MKTQTTGKKDHSVDVKWRVKKDNLKQEEVVKMKVYNIY
jgi:hypothetical protein